MSNREVLPARCCPVCGWHRLEVKSGHYDGSTFWIHATCPECRTYLRMPQSRYTRLRKSEEFHDHED